jgi:hypothetical protein
MEKSGQTIMHQVAEGMSKQAIENMQRQNAEEIDKAVAATESAAASARVAELESQLAEMRQFMATLAVGITPVSVDDAKPAVAQAAARTPQTASTAVASTSVCTNCGGPLRKPGAKGPTPKSVCYDCRAAARRGAA